MIGWIVIAVVLYPVWRGLSRLVIRLAERDAQRERERFERVVDASERVDQNLQLLQASRAVRASGLASERKAVS